MPEAYLEHPALCEYFEITESDNNLLIRRGELGLPCLVFHVPFVTEGKAIVQFERLVSVWQEKGFISSTASLPIVDGCHVHMLVGADICEESLHAKIFDIAGGERLREGRKRVFHIRNGLTIDGDFDFEVFADMGLGSAVIVDGGVRVTGVLSQLSYTYPSPILIFGDVFAHSFAHRDSHLTIEGNLTVDNVVYGEYNDGCLYVNGEVRGLAWISQDHDMDAVKLVLPIFDDENEYEGLDESLLDEEDGLDTDRVREYISNRKSPLIEGFKYEPPPALVFKTVPLAASALTTQMRALAARDDTEGMVDLLEQFPSPNEEWLVLAHSRLIAPSSTEAQKQRLHKLRVSEAAERARSNVTQVPTFAESAPEVKNLVKTMDGAGGGARTEKLLLQAPLDELTLLRHSNVLMVNVLLKNMDFPGRYLGLLERLLKNGAHVDGTESLVYMQPDVVTLVKQHRPAVKLLDRKKT